MKRSWNLAQDFDVKTDNMKLTLLFIRFLYEANGTMLCQMEPKHGLQERHVLEH